MQSIKSKIILAVIITAIIVGGGVYFWQKLSQPIDAIPSADQQEFENWTEYKSSKGFSFKYPPGYGINETLDPADPKNTIIHIVETDETGKFVQGAVPSLQINISQNAVSFALWEGIPWEGFPTIVETFKNK